MRLLLNLIIIITLGIAFTLFRAEHQVNQTIEIATEECNLNCWPYHGKSAFFVIPESM